MIARVASTEDEAAWIARAQGMPTRRLEQTLDAVIASLLRCVTSPEYQWSGDDCYPLSSYARRARDVGPQGALSCRLERAGDVCPELRHAYRSGRLSWVKAHCLLPLLLLDIEGAWRPIWVAWAERVTVRRLEGDVERALLLRAGHSRAFARCQFHPERAQDRIPPEERQMCARDIDTEATQLLAWRVAYQVAMLFSAVRETLRRHRHPGDRAQPSCAYRESCLSGLGGEETAPRNAARTVARRWERLRLESAGCAMIPGKTATRPARDAGRRGQLQGFQEDR